MNSYNEVNFKLGVMYENTTFNTNAKRCRS